jgi:hypothetical protein
LDELCRLGFIRDFDLGLLQNAGLAGDPDRIDELRARVLDQARTLLRGIDLDVLHRAFDGDPESITEISRWLIAESRREQELKKEKETQVVARGLVMAPGKINGLAVLMLRACQGCTCLPPPELVELITVQLGIDANIWRVDPLPQQRLRALSLLAVNPGITGAELANLVGVTPAAISQWINDPEFQSELEKIRLTETWGPTLKIIYDDDE